MTHQLNLTHFKAAAKRFHKSHGDTLGFSYNKVLQELSQAFFDKPYEELKETIFKEQTEKTKHGVLLVSYGSEHFLLLVQNNEINYVSQQCVGSDMEVPYESLEMQADSLANIHNTTVLCFDLPKVLVEDYENDEVINLCKTFGLNNTKESLFLNILWNKDKNVFIEDLLMDQSTLNGDYFIEMESNYDEYENVYIFTPEHETRFGKHEFFIDFEMLSNAKYQKNNTWIINYYGQPLKVEIK